MPDSFKIAWKLEILMKFKQKRFIGLFKEEVKVLGIEGEKYF